MGKKRSLGKADLEEQLRLNPLVTQAQLKAHFKCGSSTLRQALREYGLATLKHAERPHPWLEGERHPLRRWHKENPEFGALQRGAANPIHRVKHLYADPEYIKKITTGIREHGEQKKGRSYEEVYGEPKAREYREKLRAASPARMAKFSRKTTTPELIVRRLLTEIGVEFREQFPIGYCTVDFFVPGHKVIIQADGDYWHGNPEKYPNPDARQRDRRRLDAASDSYALNRGMKVVRLWECELKSDAQACREKIMSEIFGE